MDDNFGCVSLAKREGNLVIALRPSQTLRHGKGYELALESLRESIESNGKEAALYEVLEWWVANRDWTWVNPNHLGMTERPGLAHSDQYVVDDYGNCVYLGHVFTWDQHEIVDPLTVLEREHQVVFTGHRIY